MKKQLVYITNEEYFNFPILFLDHKIEKVYPDFYKISYDLKMSVVAYVPDIEKESSFGWFYNDSAEKYGENDLASFRIAATEKPCKNVYLTGLGQEHFDYIAPFIKDTAEVLYFDKCPKIKDLSALAEFKRLKCVFVYWNNSLESLWDMKCNNDLRVISFIFVTKLKDLTSLIDSNIEYVSLDSRSNDYKSREMLFDKSVFDNMRSLKHLKLEYKGCTIDY